MPGPGSAAPFATAG
uniref:Uncharacterized protein n=1 Tax=Arundo donax TaxID=35708 RepID=A0A0A8ZKE1_ARUDO